MMEKVDQRHLHALLGTAGKSIAALPGAKRVVARMKLVESPRDFAYMLQSVDLGVDEAARKTIWEAALDEDRWRETHATLMRSAEQQLVERFYSSS